MSFYITNAQSFEFFLVLNDSLFINTSKIKCQDTYPDNFMSRLLTILPVRQFNRVVFPDPLNNDNR